MKIRRGEKIMKKKRDDHEALNVLLGFEKEDGKTNLSGMIMGQIGGGATVISLSWLLVMENDIEITVDETESMHACKSFEQKKALELDLGHASGVLLMFNVF